MKPPAQNDETWWDPKRLYEQDDLDEIYRRAGIVSAAFWLACCIALVAFIVLVVLGLAGCGTSLSPPESTYPAVTCGQSGACT